MLSTGDDAAKGVYFDGVATSEFGAFVRFAVGLEKDASGTGQKSAMITLQVVWKSV